MKTFIKTDQAWDAEILQWQQSCFLDTKSDRERVDNEPVLQSEWDSAVECGPVGASDTSGQTGSLFPNIARAAAAPLRMSPRFTNSGIFRFPYPYKADELIVLLLPRSG